MSVESAKSYVERLKTDEDFAKLVGELKSSEERMAFAKSSGFDFSAEDVKEISSELSDDELDGVAGAGCWCKSFMHEGHVI